jgi:hypothetical protein
MRAMARDKNDRRRIMVNSSERFRERNLNEFCTIAKIPQYGPFNKKDPPEKSGGPLRYDR